ncbi:MAG: low affinity iron permease family protein [Pseudobdellovibrionaceae bacterium]
MMEKLFTKFSKKVSSAAGHPATFAIAAALVVVWGVSGPIFDFSETWQLVINTGTTIITFLMVFLIQSTQNRDTQALQIKLDELIRATNGHLTLLDIEELEEERLEKFTKAYENLAAKGRKQLDEGKTDTRKKPVPIKDLACKK